MGQLLKAIANKVVKSWWNSVKWKVYWLQMIYTYILDLNHVIFFIWHTYKHATKVTQDLHFDVFQVNVMQ